MRYCSFVFTGSNRVEVKIHFGFGVELLRRTSQIIQNLISLVESCSRKMHPEFSAECFESSFCPEIHPKCTLTTGSVVKDDGGTLYTFNEDISTNLICIPCNTPPMHHVYLYYI